MSPASVDDSCIYTEEAIEIGISLFGSRVCGGCGSRLPANRDYFAPSKQTQAGLTYNCRRCRRAVQRASKERWASTLVRDHGPDQLATDE